MCSEELVVREGPRDSMKESRESLPRDEAVEFLVSML